MPNDPCPDGKHDPTNIRHRGGPELDAECSNCGVLLTADVYEWWVVQDGRDVKPLEKTDAE